MPTITIQANDTLFFRDGRPFSMGEESFAQGIFPPPPSVIHGAIRTVAVAQALANGEPKEEGILNSAGLNISRIALQTKSDCYQSTDFWFPKPADLIVPKPKNKRKPEAICLLRKSQPNISNYILPEILVSPTDDKTDEDAHLLTLSTLSSYLNGEGTSFSVSPLRNFLLSEAKIGIGRSFDARTVENGKLFRVMANRPATINKNGDTQRLCVAVDYKGIEIPKDGLLAFGAEYRTAAFSQTEMDPIPCPDLDGALEFKIYLSTPAIFEFGWKPEKLLKKYGLTLLAAALERAIPIGGWDLDKRYPKIMVQAVAAGSVYYVKANSLEKALLAANAIHGTAISDSLNQTDYASQGFGIALVGKIKNNV